MGFEPRRETARLHQQSDATSFFALAYCILYAEINSALPAVRLGEVVRLSLVGGAELASFEDCLRIATIVTTTFTMHVFRNAGGDRCCRRLRYADYRLLQNGWAQSSRHVQQSAMYR